jgi:hypothetical protein
MVLLVSSCFTLSYQQILPKIRTLILKKSLPQGNVSVGKSLDGGYKGRDFGEYK